MPVTKSPLRYPGGKTQLSEFLKHTLNINELEEIIYCEPFSGGFGAGLELLFANRVDSVIINDLDLGIYSVWYAILNNIDKFTYLIKSTPVTIDEWYKQKNIYNINISSNRYSIELAYATFFLNRTNRSGIITGGPIGGYAQKSSYTLDCRMNKTALIEKMNDIHDQKNRIQLYNYEANQLIKNVLFQLNPENLFVFFDPPYYKQGKNLYTNFFTHDDHVTLRKYIELLKNHKWIVTYDCEDAIKKIYSNYNALEYTIRYSANKIRKESEYLFYSPVTHVESFGKIELNNAIKAHM